MKREYYILILALLALTACSDKPNDEPSDLVSLDLLTPVIVAESDSRARPIEGTLFPAFGSNSYNPINPDIDYNTYYSFTFFIYEEGTESPHLNNSNNALYRFRSYYNGLTGHKTYYSWPDGTPQARIGSNIVVYAYYPWSNNTKSPKAVKFSTNSQLDWMWAELTTIRDVSINNRTASMEFHHAMTCIEIRLSTLYNSTIDLYNITLSDRESKLVSSGTMDISDGSLTYTPNQSQIIISATEKLPVHTADNQTYRSYSFIMPEKEFSAGDLTLSFRYDGGKYGRADFTIPTTFTNSQGKSDTITKFETGKRYILNLMIDNTDLIVPLSFVKDDWVTNDVNLKI